MVAKVIAAQAAIDLIESLKQRHGALIFHQSGRCCDTSTGSELPRFI
jgi:uncharacterized protein